MKMIMKIMKPNIVTIFSCKKINNSKGFNICLKKNDFYANFDGQLP